jgi:predicted metal-dependent phosphoesterase TrpH
LRLKIDLHVHTVYSDGLGNIEEVMRMAKLKGLDGLAITDHDTLEGYHEAVSSDSGLLILPGFEAVTDAGHVLVLGLERLPPRIRTIGYEELGGWARELGGLCVLAHPAAGRFRLDRWEMVKPDAVEVLNASYPSEIFVWRGQRLADGLGLPALGGSDAHHPHTVGDAYTVVEVDNPKVSDVLKAIRSGSVGFEGSLSPMLIRSKIGIRYLIHKLEEKLKTARA